MEILLQLLVEGIMIGAFAFLLASVFAPSLSIGVADYLVGYQVQAEQERTAADEGMVSSTINDGETEVVGVQIQIDCKIIISTAGSILGIIVISILGSGIYVVVQKPKDILSRMS